MTSVDAWFQLLVGQWWTPESDLNIVGAAATTRRTSATTWQHFSDQLRQELSGSLNPELQKGMTADSIREAFTWGADQAGDVAETNGTISNAHRSAHGWVTDLNSRLATIAHDGKSRIQQIQDSKDLAPIKLGKIVGEVMNCQQEANAAAAPCTQNIFEAMQTVLDRRGIPKSARQFAQEQGLDTTHMLGSPNKETVTEQVKGILNQSGPPKAPTVGDQVPHIGGGAENLPSEPPPILPEEPGASAPPLQAIGGAGPGSSPQPAPQSVGTGGSLSTFGPGIQGGPVQPPAAPAGGPTLPGPVAPSGLPAASTPPLPTTAMSSTPTAPAVSAPGLSTGVPSNNLLQGAPISPNAVPPPVMGPVEPQLPAGPAIADVPASPSAAHAPVFDVPSATTDTM
ncbi:MAG: hypothetical protein ACRDTS_19735, partial [Mycobacterium sp.]